jgi:hypothetical protein
MFLALAFFPLTTAVSLLDNILPAFTVYCGVWDVLSPKPIFSRAEVSKSFSFSISISFIHTQIKLIALEFSALATGIATDGAGAIALIGREESTHLHPLAQIAVWRV